MPLLRTLDGLDLHYSDEGDGGPDALPLLCLAGLTRNGGDFDHVAPHLRAMRPGLRLIRLDARGRGRSDRGDPATYNVPQEAHDVLLLLDHLGIDRAAILGTSRGGLVAMLIAATAKHRLRGVALNDIGPEIAPGGLETIKGYIGRNPPERTWAEAAAARARAWTRFEGVPQARWLAEVRNHYDEGPAGLTIRYDPRLRDAVLAAGAQPVANLWPLFDALAGLPLALIRGANSDLLDARTADEMARRRPDMIRAEVPGRGHVPFLDEPQALDALRTWLEKMT